MNMKTVDNIKLILEIIYGDHYLKTYFSLRFKDLHIGQPIDKMVTDFAQFRNDIIKERVEKSTPKEPLLNVTRVIDLI